MSIKIKKMKIKKEIERKITMDKIISGYKRRLTFIFKYKKLRIGSKYNYVAIPKSNKIYIVPSSSDNGLKISKKKGCNRIYSLIDIRNKKVRKVTGKADKLIGLIKSFIPNPNLNRIISVAEALAISGFDYDFKILGERLDAM